MRHQLIARVVEGIPASALADGLTRASATDTAWVIASPESYDLLVRRRGYEASRFQEWMRVTLEGITFSDGISSTDEPAVFVRDLTGRLTTWIEVGAPSR